MCSSDLVPKTITEKFSDALAQAKGKLVPPRRETSNATGKPLQPDNDEMPPPDMTP